MKYSRFISLLTAGYGAFALAQPRHLAKGLQAPVLQAPAYDRMAYTFAGRDLPISAIAITSKSSSVVTAMMVLRIVGDFSDALNLATSTDRSDVRGKVLGVTLGWAALNTAALVADRRALKS